MRARVLGVLSVIGMTLALAGGAHAQFGGGFGGPQPPQPQPQPQQQQGPLQTITPEQMAGLLGQVGFTGAQMVNSNDPKFKLIKMTANGVGVGNVLIGFFNCDANGCPAYQFAMMFGKQNVDAKFINTYNINQLLAKLVLTDSGDVLLISGGLLAGGVTPAQIVNTAKLFVGSVQTLTSNQ